MFVRRPCAAALALIALAGGGCGQDPAPRPRAPAAPPTFTTDVAPIVFEHCAPCHRPGQAAPFTLLSYADARSHAEKIARAVVNRQMPPWPPAPGPPAFAGERRLRDDQIDVLRRWAEGGTPEGAASDLPKAPEWPAGWQLGTPDLIVTPPRAYVLAAGKEDVYRNLVVPLTLSATRFVRAVEFDPGDAPVHHAVIHVDRTSGSRRRDGGDGQPGFDGMGGPGTQDPDGQFLGWAPGRGPIVAPASMPWRLERGTDLVVELHLMPGASARSVRPSIAIYFTDQAAAQAPAALKMGSQAIEIPPGARDYEIRDTFVLPADVTLLSLYPHAHFLGKDMQVQAILPDGTSRRLLHIPQWSFHWQQDYRLVEPMPLPAGTTIAMRFTYDNSADNEDNPHQPPVTVVAGQRSTDEMGNLLVQVAARSPAARAQLVAAFAAHEAQVNLAGAEVLARRAPDVAWNQRLLGSSYAEAGRPAEAIAPLERALVLDPRMSEAHNDLGGVLAALGRTRDALPHFEAAARLSPNDEHLHFNLGRVLAAVGREADAVREFRRALALNEPFAEAHDALGVLLFARDQNTEALAHFRRAVQLSPDSPEMQNDLGGALAQAGRFADALEHVRRALDLRPDYPDARENLQRIEQALRRGK